MQKRFSDNAMGRIARVVRQVESQPQTSRNNRRPAGQGLFEFFLGKTDGSGITARSGTTPGSGTVTLYYLDADTTVLTVQTDADAAEVTETVYNLSDSAVGNSVYVMIIREYITGTFWAVWEDC